MRYFCLIAALICLIASAFLKDTVVMTWGIILSLSANIFAKLDKIEKKNDK